MEEMVLDTKEEFNRIIDFVTREALTWELHSVEVELFRRLLKMWISGDIHLVFF
ncbi:MAG: hypothetical protein V1792_12025 [Pseudomonadota bacterium]